ncbi:unnamed protein product, partial [Phaeothamnion confervicola]
HRRSSLPSIWGRRACGTLWPRRRRRSRRKVRLKLLVNCIMLAPRSRRKTLQKLVVRRSLSFSLRIPLSFWSSVIRSKLPMGAPLQDAGAANCGRPPSFSRGIM